MTKLEGHSVSPNVLVCGYSKSLSSIALTAFANHYPLSLRPDDIWLAIAYGFAKHVDTNAEALRSKFVSFEGKKKIEYRNVDMQMGQVPHELWERKIFPYFSEEIRKEIGGDLHDRIVPSFSTSTKTDRSSMEITLMSATSKYFSYGMRTRCGIPWIELH